MSTTPISDATSPASSASRSSCSRRRAGPARSRAGDRARHPPDGDHADAGPADAACHLVLDPAVPGISAEPAAAAVRGTRPALHPRRLPDDAPRRPQRPRPALHGHAIQAGGAPLSALPGELERHQAKARDALPRRCRGHAVPAAGPQRLRPAIDGARRPSAKPQSLRLLRSAPSSRARIFARRRPSSARCVQKGFPAPRSTSSAARAGATTGGCSRPSRA